MRIKASMRSKRGSTKRVNAKVIVHRTAERGNAAFEACVRIGSRISTLNKSGFECAHGKNPRKAVANALVRVGRTIGKRKGAFAGSRWTKQLEGISRKKRKR